MQCNSPIPAKIASKTIRKKEPLRFDRLKFSISGPEFADQLEEVALPLIAQMLGAKCQQAGP